MSNLHADIFGDDDSDEDDAGAVVQHTTAPDAAAAADSDDDDKADQILETARHNALLNPGGKKLKKTKEKKEKAPKETVGRGGKRKAAPDGETLRKRLKKRSEAGGTSAEGEAGGEAGGEEGAAGVGGGGDSDPDSDSVEGEQAIEEGGKKDRFEQVMAGLKHKRGGPQFSREKITQDVQSLQERMEQAVEKDDEAARELKPALHKVALLSEVEAMMRKKQHHEVRAHAHLPSSHAHLPHAHLPSFEGAPRPPRYLPLPPACCSPPTPHQFLHSPVRPPSSSYPLSVCLSLSLTLSLSVSLSLTHTTGHDRSANALNPRAMAAAHARRFACQPPGA